MTSLRLFFFILLLCKPLYSAPLTLQQAYDALDAQTDTSSITELKRSPFTHLTTLKTISPGYSFEEQRVFLKTSLPFPSKLNAIKRYNLDTKSFSELLQTKDRFYTKLIINNLFHTILLHDKLIQVTQQEKDLLKRNQFIFERKKLASELKILLQLPYSETIELAGELDAVSPQSIVLTTQQLTVAYDDHVESVHAKKLHSLEVSKLKSLSTSYLPNFLITLEYWNDRDQLSSIIGFDFPILDSRHRNLIQTTKSNMSLHEVNILKMSNEVRISLNLMVDEVNFIVEQLNLYDKMPIQKKIQHSKDVLRLKSRYATIISDLNLITKTSVLGTN